MPNMIDNIENMNKKTKMILSVVGVCAVIVPALLLWYLSTHSKQAPQINSSKRQVDTVSVQTSSQSKPTPTPRIVSTPISTATPSVAPQSTSSAR